MKIQRIPTSNGIDDIRLSGETELDDLFIKQLAEAGTLCCLNRHVSGNVVFRPISVMPEISSVVSSKNSIGKYDFLIRQNESHTFDLSFKSNDVPIDLTQYTEIKLQVKKQKGSSSIIQLSVGNGLVVSGPSHNVLKVSMSANQTKLLSCEAYYYDVLLSKPGLNIYYVEGVITVKRSTTR